jgi:hypothetical protein
MADYYPLISRAVAGLEKNNGENRRAVYERARAALLAQLRGVTPPLNESDITRERLALEESIRKVEAESARQFVEASRLARAAKARSVEPRSTTLRQSDDAASGRTGPVELGAPPRRYAGPTSQPSRDAPSALSRAFVAAGLAGFAAVGFDLRPAVAAGASARALRRRAARIFGHGHQGSVPPCQ